MQLDRIINETIQRFIIKETDGIKSASNQISNKVSGVVKKDVPSATKKQINKVENDTKGKTLNILKKSAKTNGWGDAQKEKARRYKIDYGHEVSEESFTEAYNYLQAETTNLSAVADRLVDMGLLNCKKGPSAQSYLRKMSENLSAPSGGEYRLHSSVVAGILKIKGEIG